MIGLERDRVIELPPPIGEPLPGPSKNQVDRDGIERGRLRDLERKARRFRRMASSEQVEHFVLKRLDPERERIDTELPPPRYRIIVNVLRIGLEKHPHPGSELCCPQDRAEPIGLQQ